MTAKINDFKLLPNQIPNADKSVLFWKLVLDHTLVQDDKAPKRGGACAYASGDDTHKLTLMVIGKAKNPRAFAKQVRAFKKENNLNGKTFCRYFFLL